LHTIQSFFIQLDEAGYQPLTPRDGINLAIQAARFLFNQIMNGFFFANVAILS